MGPLTGPGSPDRWFVHDGRIYIFASEACRSSFTSNPENHIDRPDAAPAGTEVEKRRVAELIARALAAFGGARNVDALRSWRASIAGTAKGNSGPVETLDSVAVLFPGRYRRDYAWGQFRASDAVSGAEGFRSENQTAWPMEAFERDYTERLFLRHPLVLLQARRDPEFRAFAAGRQKLGDRDVEWLTAGLRGATSRLAIDLETGRVLAVAFRGRAGSLGDIVRTYSDFREADGLTLPFTTELSFNGKPMPSAKRTYTSIELNVALDESLFRQPPDSL